MPFLQGDCFQGRLPVLLSEALVEVLPFVDKSSVTRSGRFLRLAAAMAVAEVLPKKQQTAIATASSNVDCFISPRWLKGKISTSDLI